jgi:hypothetical protein
MRRGENWDYPIGWGALRGARLSRTETKVNMPRRMRTVARPSQFTYWGEVATSIPSRAPGRSGLRAYFVPHRQMIWMGCPWP